MNYLDKIVFNFSQKHLEFSKSFFSLFQDITEYENDMIILKRSDNRYFPRVEINCYSKENNAGVFFILDNGLTYNVDITNETGITKKSYEIYSYIKLDDIFRRLKIYNIKILKMDHIGFNLPWFADGIHPRIQNLRDNLSKSSLYHQFPTGEPWDFILPASKEEINGSIQIDYSAIRKPKIEIVSFDKCSIPLIQFDVSCSIKKDLFPTAFPEGLYDKNYGNIWLYIKNPFNIDFCLVLNENYDGDWSNFFAKSRL